MLGLLRHEVPQLGFGNLRRYDAVIGIFGVRLVIHSTGIPRDQMRRESAASLAQPQAAVPEVAHWRERGLGRDQNVKFRHHQHGKNAGRDRRERRAHWGGSGGSKEAPAPVRGGHEDRKSTRLNSSPYIASRIPYS